MHAILYGMRGVVDLPDKAAPHALSSKLEHAISMHDNKQLFFAKCLISCQSVTGNQSSIGTIVIAMEKLCHKAW